LAAEVLPFVSEELLPMKGQVAETQEVRVFLSQDGSATVQQEDRAIHLDREQIETVIQLLKLARFELKNFHLGRF
jgi:hypothetical protein